MPDETGFPTPDEIINGGKKPVEDEKVRDTQEGKLELPHVTISNDGPKLTVEQNRAIAMIIAGLPFVIMCIRPTGTGADFFTELGGDEETLRAAAPHLHDVMHRLFHNKGII